MPRSVETSSRASSGTNVSASDETDDGGSSCSSATTAVGRTTPRRGASRDRECDLDTLLPVRPRGKEVGASYSPETSSSCIKSRFEEVYIHLKIWITQTVFVGGRGDVAVRLPASPTAYRVRYPAGSLPDFRTWESCRTMLLIGEFSRGSPVSTALAFRRCFILASLSSSHLGSQDLDFKSPPLSFLFSPVGIVPDIAAGQLVLSVISRFPHPCIPVQHHSHLISPLISSKYLVVKSCPNLSTPTPF
ncbi:hypothetical protein PR048_019801 [Dryococelus australis]|uniref:Uncharacterized protein n=1 Tax=Dryococelus australis TaxID=614101 RepID=A0ABQ9H4H2_9NEOP|nr:hypothetical protein PR048_019801 [Dryococelus australis]